jgi:hypothetical protein
LFIFNDLHMRIGLAQAREMIRRAGIFVGWLLVPLACGPSEVTTEEPPGIPEAELAQRFAEALCDRRIECDCYDPLSGPVGEDPVAATLAQCIESRRLEIEHWQAQLGHLRYDGACALSRLEQMQGWSCLDDGHLAAATVAGGGQLCERPCSLYRGLGARGESCDDGEGCQQGLVCRGRYDPITYHYQVVCGDPCLDFGEACGDRRCGALEVCDYYSETCRALPQSGELCPQYACAFPDYCFPDAEDEWRCLPAGENGTPCDEVPTCLGSCVDGLCAPAAARICHWDLRNGD